MLFLHVGRALLSSSSPSSFFQSPFWFAGSSVMVAISQGDCARFPLPVHLLPGHLSSPFVLPHLPRSQQDQERPVSIMTVVQRASGERSCGIWCLGTQFVQFSKRNPHSLEEALSLSSASSPAGASLLYLGLAIQLPLLVYCRMPFCLLSRMSSSRSPLPQAVYLLCHGVSVVLNCED